MINKVRDFFNKISLICFVLACIILVLVWLSVNYQVVVRYFLLGSATWVIESVTYALLFITFLASAWVLKRDKHAKMDMVVNMLKPGGQVLLNTVTYILATILWLVIAVYSGYLTWTLIQDGVRLSTLLEPLKWPLVAVIPVGSFLLATQCLMRVIGHIRSWRVLRETEGARPAFDSRRVLE